MKKINLIVVSIMLVGIFFIAGCQKVKDTKDILSAEEVSTASNFFDDVFNQANEAAKTISEPGGLKSTTLSQLDGGCSTITITPLDATFPKTITIDFGTTNCTGIDGRNRRGIINATLSNWYRTPGAVLTITTANYYLNDYKIEGTKTVTNAGYNDSQNLTFTVEILNGVVTNPDGNSFTWNTTRTREWVSGQETILNILDDVFLISGDAHGVTSKEKEYSLNIITPLEVAIDCPWIKSGTLDITVGTGSLSVDYGDGTCDPNATATVLGASVPFIMH